MQVIERERRREGGIGGIQLTDSFVVAGQR